MVDVFEPLLIDNNIATRTNKGTHIGIKKVKECLKYCLKEINRIVTDYKLELNNKTRIYHIDEGFEFLGFKYGNTSNLISKTLNRYEKDFYDGYEELLELNSKIVRIEDDGNVIMCE